MKIVDGILYIEFADFINAGWKEMAVKMANHRNGSNWQMIQNPKDKRKPLVQFDSLIDDHKKRLTDKFGKPFEWVVKEPIRHMLKINVAAETYYTGYRFNSTDSLPPKRVKQYIRAAQWLTMLNDVKDDIKTLKKQLGVNIPTFYNHVGDLMEAEKRNGANTTYLGAEQLTGDFPTSYGRLIQKQASFLDKGFDSLIDKMYGNKLAAKITDEISEAQLLSYIENENQYDDVLVCMMYNMWAKENSYKIITPATVGEWRRKKEASITINRYGNDAFNEKFIRQQKGIRPSAPLYLVEHDDNNLDLLFKDQEGYMFNKYVAIVVKDSYCDLVLGKSYRMAQSPVTQMIYHAYLDAMYYIRSLTGGWYLPFEIKSDRWQGKSLEPFYESVAKFVKPAKGNKHRGYIEQSFGNPLWKRAQQLVSQGNYSGNNITAQNRGVNTDALRLRVQGKLGPTVGIEAEQQIENFFHLLRHMPDFKRTEMNAPSKEQKWLAAWNELPEDKKRPISDEQMLMIFGIKHEPNGRSIMISNRGVEPQICGTKYTYDLPESWMYNDLIGENVNVFFEPFDMSRVLVSNGSNIRFIARTAELQPRALQDTYTGSRTYLNAILQEKKLQVKEVADASEKRKRIAKPFNAEAMLQGGVMVKEIKNEAEHKMIEDFSTKHESFLDENTDFDKFFND